MKQDRERGGYWIARSSRAMTVFVAGLVAISLLLAPLHAKAQTYPDRPIRILVPYGPGGLTDVVARLFAEQLRQILGGTIVVENKPGASGIIAIQEMARAAPDGYTIMIGNISTNGLTPVLLARRLKVDYDRDVAIIARLADVPVFFLETTSDFPPRTFAEFIAYAKANPGMVRYGSAGIGSYQHINTLSLAQRAGIALSHIPFKDGGAQLLQNLASGQVQVSWFNITNPIGMIDAHRVAPLAIAAPRRLPEFPGVPTIGEVGFPGVRAAQWVAAFAPAATPADILERLHAAFAQAAASPELAKAFRTGGMTAPPQGSLADARAWLKDEMESWRREVDALHIVLEE